MARMDTGGSAAKRERWRDERVARDYEARRFAGPLARLKHRRDIALVLELLGSAAGVRRVLDLPCGTGRLLPALHRAGYEAVGADVALEMMRAGRAERPGERPALVQAEAGALPFRSGAFDAVVSLRFLFHLEGEELRRALAEMRRVTRAGVVVGQVRYRWTLKHGGRWLRSRVGFGRRYRPSQGRSEIARELESAGLELVGLRPVSRLFSDKAFFLARPPYVRASAPAMPSEVMLT
jgi:SAM-dependent methyltransferase